MARKRRNQKRKHKGTQENTTNDTSETKREDFLWNNERKIALLNCMMKRKPAGLHKHINMLLIKSHLSERLKVDVPIKAIWSFLHAHWNMNEADRIEYQAIKIKKKNFELPQTEEWTRLIKEQGALINSKNTNTDIEKAFDNIDWQIMFSIMKELNLDFKDRRIIYNLYKNQSAEITINNESAGAKIGGVQKISNVPTTVQV